jgi:molecular chaperone GrpE
MSDPTQPDDSIPDSILNGDTAPEAAPAPGGDSQSEIANLKDQLLRALAETENVRRRSQKEREDTAKYAVSGFAKELLGVADNLRRALSAVPAGAREGNEVLNTMLTGIEATERQLTAAFERAGIQRLEPVGQPFDPNFHQVVMEVDSDQPPGTVVQELQAGYTIHGRLLREAMVAVARR